MKRAQVSLKNNLTAYVFLSPWLLGLITLVLGPMIASLYLAFTDYSILTAPKWIGMSNFITMFSQDPNFLQSLKVTFVFVFISVPLKLIMALGMAMLLNKGIRGLALYRTIYYIPSLLGSSVAIAILWQKVFGGEGIFNKFLLIFGLEGVNWVSNPKYSLYSIILLSIWQFGSSMIIFLAGIKQIPVVYYEASSVDGAGKLRNFFNITIPFLTPIIFFNLIMQTIMSFQTFTQAFIVSNGTGGPVNSLLFYSLYLYQKGFSFFQMGYAAAMAWFLLLIISMFTLILFYSSRFWVHYEDGGT